MGETIKIRLQPQVRAQRAYTYRLANQIFAMDASPVQLGRFATTGPATLLSRGLDPEIKRFTEGGAAFRVEGLLDGQWREVKVRSGHSGYLVWISGVGEFWVSADGCDILSRDCAGGVDPDTVLEAVLGPPVMLALALRGVWCLHASAVMVDERGVAFLGDSGKGKSTLAAFFDTEHQPVAQRISDDILPVETEPDRLLALPHFPQLKLPPEQQLPMGTPEKLPLAAIYTVHSPRTHEQDAVKILPLSPRQATLALLRHTVASRLFAPPLLERHLGFCADAAGRAPVRRLSYPRRREWLPRVCDALLADLEALGLSVRDGAKRRT